MSNNNSKGQADKSLEEEEFYADVETQIIIDQFLLQVENHMIAKNISKAALAVKLGYSLYFLKKVLDNDVDFHLITMFEISTALGCRLQLKLHCNTD